MCFSLLPPPDLWTNRTQRLLRRKNALSMIYMSMMTVAVVSFQVSFECLLPNFALILASSLSQWFFWGFSLAFSETGSRFIGDLSMCYMNVEPNYYIDNSFSRILWYERRGWLPFNRKRSYTIPCILRVPAHVRRDNVCSSKNHSFFSLISLHQANACPRCRL